MWQTLKDEIREQHALFDEEIQRWIESYRLAGGRLYCGKRCSNCCTLAVNATFAEALCTAEALSEHQAANIREHAIRLREHVGEVSDLKSYLKMHRQKIGSCPLLHDDGSCGIYGERPFSCRSLLSTKESRWCGLDFGELPLTEKVAYIESLDTSVVSFPMHYVAATQDLGQELESRATLRMAERFGFSLYGNFPFLVYLEREFRLSEVASKGSDATTRFLEREGLLLPFLVILDT